MVGDHSPIPHANSQLRMHDVFGRTPYIPDVWVVISIGSSPVSNLLVRGDTYCTQGSMQCTVGVLKSEAPGFTTV